ncbi:MAG: thiaminase II, partial [Nitrososphaerota archaeon]
EWGLAAEELSRYTMSPVNTAYTNFLTATAYDKPFIQGLAAILPCFWVYLEVGKTLVRKGSPNKTYQRWIETYASEEYERNVKALVEIVDKHGEKISETEARAAIRLFRLSTVYEYLFWDESYRLVGWPFRL